MARIVSKVRKGELDILPGLTRTEKREEYLNFTAPFVEIPRVIITRSDRTDVHSLEDLSGKTVSVVKDFAIHEWLEKDFPSIALRPYASPERALEALAFGEVDAYVSDLASAAYLIDKLGLSRLKVAAHAPSTTALSVGVRKDWPELVPMLDKAISSITPEERAAIRNRWIVLRRTGISIKQAILVGVPVLLVAVLLSLAVSNRRLRREINWRADAESALRESEECFRRIVEGAPDAVFVQTGGLFAYLNKPALELLGAESEGDLLGKPVIDRFDPRFHDLVRERIRLLNIEKLQVPAVEEVILRTDGSGVPVEVSAVPIQFQGQDRALVFARDITERKHVEELRLEHEAHLEEMVNRRTAELAESESHIRTILETCLDAIITIDERGIMETFNPAAAKIFGYSPEEAVGRPVDILMPEPYRSNHNKYLRRYLETGEAVVIGKVRESTGLRKDGRTFPIELAVNEFIIGNVRHFTGVVRDITEKKRIVEELEDAKQSADAANKAKSEFLANMSHEIRTPLNAIIGFSNLALKTDMTTKQHDYISKIHGAGVSLLGVINDILDFSKIEAGKLDIEQIDFDLEDVLNRVVAIVGEAIYEKDLEFLLYMPPDIPRSLVGDPLRLGQVLLNLVSNGVKFTERGELEIRVAALEETDGKAKLRFEVRDSEIGLMQEQASKLFRTFSQVDGSTTRKYGGSGLGLSISKHLVEMMSGDIWVESELGKGSTFFFTAWFGLSPGGERRRRVVPQRLSGLRVLVVDDNPVAREILVRSLEDMSFSVSAVACASAAVAAIRERDPDRPYDLVLMDWKMPGMDGVEATRLIKRDTSLRRIPAILIVTASGGVDLNSQAQEAKADGLLTKPVSPSTLFDTIVRLFAPGAVSRVGAVPEEGDETYALQGARVLLAEDNEINQEIAVELLTEAGVIVEVAADGREAVDKLMKSKAGRPYDMVLMDIQMPEMDGYEATKLIRTDKSFADLPIIAMTSHAMVEERQRCTDAGMNDHIPKPIDQQARFATMSRWYKPRGTPQLRPFSTVQTGEHEEFELPIIPGIDVEDGLKRVARNKKLYLKLLRKYGDECEHAANLIADALSQGEDRTAERLAHTVAGVSGNIGAYSAQAAAADLESSIRNNDPPE